MDKSKVLRLVIVGIAAAALVISVSSVTHVSSQGSGSTRKIGL